MRYDKESKNFIFDIKDLIIIILIVAVVAMAIILLKDRLLIKNSPSQYETITAIQNTEMAESSELVETQASETQTETEPTTVKLETTVQTTTTKKAVSETKAQAQTIAPTTAPSINYNAPGVTGNTANTTTVNKGWVQYSNKWYYFNNNGQMLTSIKTTIDGDTYYFDSTGTMITSAWVEVDDYWYYFGQDGKMLTNTTTPDGYKVDARGRLKDNVAVDDETKSNGSSKVGPGVSSSGPSSSNGSSGLPENISYSGPGGGKSSANTGSIDADTTGVTYKLGTLYSVSTSYTTGNNHAASISIKLPQITNSSGSANVKFNNYIKSIKDSIVAEIQSILEDNDDGEDFIKSFKAEAVKISEQDESYMEIKSTGVAKTKTNESISTDILISYEKDTGAITFEVSSE